MIRLQLCQLLTSDVSSAGKKRVHLDSWWPGCQIAAVQPVVKQTDNDCCLLPAHYFSGSADQSVVAGSGRKSSRCSKKLRCLRQLLRGAAFCAVRGA